MHNYQNESVSRRRVNPKGADPPRRSRLTLAAYMRPALLSFPMRR